MSKHRTLTVAGLNVLVWSLAIAGWLLAHFSRGTVLYAQVLIIAAILVLGLAAMAYGTIKKTKWGVNLDPVCCPRCGKPARQFRLPKTPQQALWGGGTCSACGAEVDKWGREISPTRNDSA